MYAFLFNCRTIYKVAVINSLPLHLVYQPVPNHMAMKNNNTNNNNSNNSNALEPVEITAELLNANFANSNHLFRANITVCQEVERRDNSGKKSKAIRLTLVPCIRCRINKVFGYIEDEWKIILKDILQTQLRKEYIINEISFYGINMFEFSEKESDTLDLKYYFLLNNNIGENGYILVRNPIAKICNQIGVKYTMNDIYSYRKALNENENNENDNGNENENDNNENDNGIGESMKRLSMNENDSKNNNNNNNNNNKGAKRRQLSPFNETDMLEMGIDVGNIPASKRRRIGASAARKVVTNGKNKSKKNNKNNNKKTKLSRKGSNNSSIKSNSPIKKDALHRFNKLQYQYKPIKEQRTENMKEYLYCWVEDSKQVKSSKGQHPFSKRIQVRDGSIGFDEPSYQIMMFSLDANKFPHCGKGDILRLHRYNVQFRRTISNEQIAQGLCKFNNRPSDPQFIVINGPFTILNAFIKSGTITPLSVNGNANTPENDETENSNANNNENNNNNNNNNNNQTKSTLDKHGSMVIEASSLSHNGSNGYNNKGSSVGSSQPTIDDLKRYVQAMNNVEITQDVVKHVSSETFTWDEEIDIHLIRGLSINYLQWLIHREEQRIYREGRNQNSNYNGNVRGGISGVNMQAGGAKQYGNSVARKAGAGAAAGSNIIDNSDAISMTNNKMDGNSLPIYQLKEIMPNIFGMVGTNGVKHIRGNIVVMIVGRCDYSINKNSGNDGGRIEREFEWFIWDGTFSPFIENEDWDDVWSMFDDSNKNVVMLPFSEHSKIIGTCAKISINLTDRSNNDKQSIENRNELFIKLLTEIDCGFWVEFQNIIIQNNNFRDNNNKNNDNNNNGNDNNKFQSISLLFDDESLVRQLKPSQDSRIKKRFHHLMQSLSKYTHCVTTFTHEHFKYQSYTLIRSILKQNTHLIAKFEHSKVEAYKICKFTNYKIRGTVIDYRPKNISQWAMKKTSKNKNNRRKKRNQKNNNNSNNENDNEEKNEQSFDWCFELTISDCNGVLPVAFVGYDAELFLGLKANDMNLNRELYEALEKKRNIFCNQQCFVDLCVRAYPLKNANHIAYKCVNTILIDNANNPNNNENNNETENATGNKENENDKANQE